MTPPKPKNYVAIAKRYAEAVVSGKIAACKWVKRACKRQIDDLKRTDWQYKFDTGKANRVCRFIEGFKHIKGEWAKRSETITLEPWQCFIYTTVFGWVCKPGTTDEQGRDLSGKRRFRIAYDEMGRKNSKTTMSAPLGIYMMCADGEEGAEVYSAATTRDQAKIVWEQIAKPMVERDGGFRKTFGVETSAHSIYQPSSSSFFLALSAEGNSLDGLNVHCAIIDELHAHQTDKVYNVIESSRGSRLQPLIWVITTAGFNQSGICYQIRNYLTKVLDGTVKDETFFGVIYTLDDNDDWQDERNWIKANPNLGVSVYLEEMRNEARKASKMASALTNFLTKRMCVWVSASVNLFNITAWNTLANSELAPEQFKTDPCWLSLDFAPRNDFTSTCQLFKREEKDGTHFYAFFAHFLSEGKVQESENASYRGWAREGWIKTNPGNQTSTKAVADHLVSTVDEGYQVQELLFDPSRTQGIEEMVEDECGVVLAEVQQNPRNLCPAVEYLSALIADGKIHHNGDPIASWALSNVIGKPKGNWGMYPDKENPENKIDPITALLTALSRAMVSESTSSIYSNSNLESAWIEV